MRPPLRLLVISCAFLLGIASRLAAADSASTAAGYWEGAIALPDRELPIRVELTAAADASWKGTIDIPAQGLRGFPLTPLKVSGKGVEFGLASIPGDPRFTGTLSEDGKAIAGEFFQGGNTLTFRLERKAKPAPEPDAFPDFNQPGVAGKGLPGTWRGTLKPIPGVELRLLLELSGTGSTITGEMTSLDQGRARIPISNLTDKEGVVRFETPNVNGSFEGRMNADGSELSGTWRQVGRETPLVFRRGAAKP